MAGGGELCLDVSARVLASLCSSCLSSGRRAGWRGVDALLDLEEGVLLVGGGHHLVAIWAALSYRALVIRGKRSLSRRQWEKRRESVDSESIRHLNLEVALAMTRTSSSQRRATCQTRSAKPRVQG